ncbi:GIY-YIG nuclease family protein [Brevundimonas diminuta]|uniref:GIY-YIG nuclease family protein n=1 Tax=Brevundimonas diminuta TaxID=293 RepID=UPI003D9A37E0
MANSKVSSDGSREQAFVYVIGPDGGPFKVGFTSSPKDRLCFLNSASPTRLSIRYIEEVPHRDRQLVEKYAHALLWGRHTSGEWFNVSEEQGEMAVKLAVAGVAAGKLPPGPSAREAQQSGSPKRKDREKRWGARARIVRAYYDLATPAGPGSPRYCPDEEVMRRARLRDVHDQIEARCGPTAITLLSLVVAQGRAITSLSGSHRQGPLLERRLKEALDCFGSLTAD